MATVSFYEKAGCSGNAKQKALLRAAGHQVQERDLRDVRWSNVELLEFLGPLPVTEWFNSSAPAVKAGEIVPEQLDQVTALALLRDNPLLIRRPLLRVGDERRVGFDATKINAWIGLKDVPPGNLEACAHKEQEVVTSYYVQTVGGGAMLCRFTSKEPHAGRCKP